MKIFRKQLSPKEIVGLVGGEFSGEHSLILSSVSDPDGADPTSVVFIEQDKYLETIIASRAGLIICGRHHAEKLTGRNLLISDKPYFSLMVLVSIWLRLEASDRIHRVDPAAVIADDVNISSEVTIGANAVISSGCKIGEGSVIEAGCNLGENVSLGKDCHLFPNVTIYSETVIGDRVTIHSGAVIGADGFGYLPEGGKQLKIPQIGNVEIGNDVEIGANTTIDRATLGTTRIGEGTKIDNLVQIGHNCVVGKHCILCAQVGLAGSTIVGDYVYLAGQSGAAGHITIGTGAMVGAQSGISHDVPQGAKYFGTPAREAAEMKRIMAAERALPQMYREYMRSMREKG